MELFDCLKHKSEGDVSLAKVRALLESVTESIREKFTCQVLPPDIIPGERWKTGTQTEISIVDFVRLDNNWTINEFEKFLDTKKVYICSIHIRIDLDSMNDNIVSPTYGHWGDWDMEAWLEGNLHVPVLSVGVKRDLDKNPYRCFRFVIMEPKI